MSTQLGSTLPPALRDRLAGAAPAFGNTAVPICTIDPDGFPHPAMVTGDDVAAPAPDRLRVVLYAGTRTAKHLAENGLITLLFVDEHGVHYVKARADAPPRPDPSRATFCVADLRIASVLEDAPDPVREGGTAIVSGIRFRRAGQGTA